MQPYLIYDISFIHFKKINIFLKKLLKNKNKFYLNIICFKNKKSETDQEQRKLQACLHGDL